MRILRRRLFIGLCFIAGSLSLRSQEKETPKIVLTAPYSVKIGEPFQIQVSIIPTASKPVKIIMEQGGITYSQNKFAINPGEQKILTAKAKGTVTGLGYVHAAAEGGEYEDSYITIDLGFLGHLKLSSSEKLTYRVPATLTVSIVDNDGKSLPISSGLTLLLDSSDAALSSGKDRGPLTIDLDPGVRLSPQFQVISLNRNGGIVHLNGTLVDKSGKNLVLDQQSFTLNADPAWWLPVVLAIGGGLLHGLYKIVNLPRTATDNQILASIALLITSGVAGFIGYLIANLDLLGLKLDPNVLRTYPLLGFLLAYFGIDILLPKKLFIK